jgi:hypothetical protein
LAQILYGRDFGDEIIIPMPEDRYLFMGLAIFPRHPSDFIISFQSMVDGKHISEDHYRHQ